MSTVTPILNKSILFPGNNFFFLQMCIHVVLTHLNLGDTLLQGNRVQTVSTLYSKTGIEG